MGTAAVAAAFGYLLTLTPASAATHIILLQTSGDRTVTPVIGPSGHAMVVGTDAPGPAAPPEALQTTCKVSVSGLCAVSGPNLSFIESSGLDSASAAGSYAQCDTQSCNHPTCQSDPSPGYCNYGDPQDTGCNQGNVWVSEKTEAVWDSTDGTYMTVFLKFGYNCQSNWGITQFTGDPTDGVDSWVGYGGNIDTGTDYGWQSDEVYSAMLYGGSDAPNCVRAYGSVAGYVGEAIPSGCY